MKKLSKDILLYNKRDKDINKVVLRGRLDFTSAKLINMELIRNSYFYTIENMAFNINIKYLIMKDKR